MKNNEMKRSAWKKGVCLLAGLVLALGLTACGHGEEKKSNAVSNVSNVKDVLQARANQEGKNASQEQGSAEEKPADTKASEVSKESEVPESKEVIADAGVKDASVDVDLTSMSSTMIYSEVYNMMYNPDDYVGKTVKMKGVYAVSDAGETRYDLCVIQDATACCAQGMEFVLADAYSYPDDYPEIGNDIVVTGVFETYFEGEYQYCTLKNAKLL